MNHQCPEYEPSNKTGAVDIAVDNSSIVYPSDKKTIVKKKKEKRVLATGEEKKEGNLVSTVIGLFENIFPGDFANKSKSPYAIPVTREAIEKLLERFSLAEINVMIQKYDAGKADPYRPSVGTVYEFCTFKLAKVEAYVQKSAGGLHAQKPVSTPEQSKVRDAQYQKIFDATKEKTRKAKEEWEKEQRLKEKS